MVGFIALNFCLEAELPDVRAVKEGNTYLSAYLPNVVQADKQPLCFTFTYYFIPDWVLYVVFCIYLDSYLQCTKEQDFHFKNI